MSEMTLADFKVGDRVRVVADLSGAPDAGERRDVLDRSDVTVGVCKGYESTIVGSDEGLPALDCVYITTPDGMTWAMFPEMLQKI